MSERLYRSREDRMIAGVAGGLAERLGVDTSVVRIAWAILILPTGFLAVLAYIVMAIIVPDEDEVFRDPPMSAGTGVPGWPSSPAFPSQSSVGPQPPGAAPASAPSMGGQASGPAWTQPPPGYIARPSPQPLPGADTRRSRRRTERAERRSRRPGAAPFIIGGSLVVLGSWFLLREYVPALDLSRLWPLAVVGLGVLLVILALSQRSDDHGGHPG